MHSLNSIKKVPILCKNFFFQYEKYFFSSRTEGLKWAMMKDGKKLFNKIIAKLQTYNFLPKDSDIHCKFPIHGYTANIY